MANDETAQQKWFVLDVEGQVVGRIATRIATILMGKHKPNYTPHCDCGDYVVIVNCEKVKFTGKAVNIKGFPYFTRKTMTKTYERYTGYPSGQRWETAASLLQRKPEQVLKEAVRRMLPKNKIGRHMLEKLKLYAGPNHPHQAQQPAEVPTMFLSAAK